MYIIFLVFCHGERHPFPLGKFFFEKKGKCNLVIVVPYLEEALLELRVRVAQIGQLQSGAWWTNHRDQAPLSCDRSV
jgi:hypothetical protein